MIEISFLFSDRQSQSMAVGWLGWLAWLAVCFRLLSLVKERASNAMQCNWMLLYATKEEVTIDHDLFHISSISFSFHSCVVFGRFSAPFFSRREKTENKDISAFCCFFEKKRENISIFSPFFLPLLLRLEKCCYPIRANPIF